MPAGYSGTPQARQLGLRPGQRVGLDDPPDGWVLTDCSPRTKAEGARPSTSGHPEGDVRVWRGAPFRLRRCRCASGTCTSDDLRDPIVNFAYRFTDLAGTMSPMSATGVAPEVRKRVLASRDRFWRPEDFDGSPDAVAQALSRMARSGEVRRVRRGLYWRGASTRLGMAPPPPGRLASAVVGGTGSGPAGWSAALVLGLSTQVARSEAVAVPGRSPRSPGSIQYVSRAASTKRRATSGYARPRSRCWKCCGTGAASSRFRPPMLSRGSSDSSAMARCASTG